MKLEDIAQDVKSREAARFGYKGELAIREIDETPCFSGRIDLLTTAKVKVGYNPEFAEEAKELEEIVEEPFREALTAVVRHELNHKGGGKCKGAPRNIDFHAEKILEPVAEVLQQKGFSDMMITPEQTLYAYFANIIEDILDNTELGNNYGHIGMFLCYKDDAEHLKDKTLTPLFDVFVRLQEKLYGGKRSKKLLENHHCKDEKAETAFNNILERTGLAKMKVDVLTRRKKKPFEVFDRKRAAQYLLDENNWQEISRIIADELSELVDKTKLKDKSYIKEIFIPLKGEADGFKDEMDDPETRMRFAWKKYEKSKGQGGEYTPPPYMNPFEALDLIYQRKARNLEILTRKSTQSESMPILKYGKRQFDPLKDRLGRARVDVRGGRLGLSVKKYEEDEPIDYSQSKGKIPSIRFIIRDDSGSMQAAVNGDGPGIVMNPWAPEENQWTDNSRYHYTLLAEWGLYELLKKHGALKHTSVKSVSYSVSTRTARTLLDAKRQALNPTFGGNTLLDMKKIDELFGKDELVLSISDGGIWNWEAYLTPPETDAAGNVVKEGIKVKDEYLKRARQNEFLHFQIGSFLRDEKGNVLNKPKFCQDLEEAGLNVFYDDGKNLGKLVIDLTRPYITRGKR